jgi:hypothetical protein
MPNPLRLAVIAKAHFDTVRLPFPPALLQKAGLALAAPLGRLLGYEPIYGRASVKVGATERLTFVDPGISGWASGWGVGGGTAQEERYISSADNG